MNEATHTNSNITLGKNALARIDVEVERRLKHLAGRFITSPGAMHAVPLGLLGAVTRHAYGAMSTDERRAHLRARLTEQYIATSKAHLRANEPKQLARKRRNRSTIVPTVSPSKASISASAMIASARAATASASRYTVGCAGGCGAMLPAPSARPVLRFCDGPRSSPKPRQRTPEQIASGAKLKRRRLRAVCGRATPTADAGK